jgi:hypothetical protein
VAKTEIKNWNGVVLYATRHADVLTAVVRAVAEGVSLRWADLGGADLGGADLRGADLQGANLRGADLFGADLAGADLTGADLTRASLHGANLRGADLRSGIHYRADFGSAFLHGAHLPWQSHDLLAAILHKAAGSDREKRKVAGLVLVSRDWCWNNFMTLDDPLTGWALDVLARFVHPADTEAGVPAPVWRRYAAARAAATPQGETPCSDAT